MGILNDLKMYCFSQDPDQWYWVPAFSVEEACKAMYYKTMEIGNNRTIMRFYPAGRFKNTNLHNGLGASEHTPVLCELRVYRFRDSGPIRYFSTYVITEHDFRFGGVY